MPNGNDAVEVEITNRYAFRVKRDRPIASNLGDPCKMSEQFYYVHLGFIPKMVTLTFPILRQREVVVEVPKDLVQHRLSALVNENLGEEEIALNLARRAALATFPTVAERLVGLYDENAPRWHEHRHHVMDERPCDHEENGVRAWRIV